MDEGVGVKVWVIVAVPVMVGVGGAKIRLSEKGEELLLVSVATAHTTSPQANPLGMNVQLLPTVVAVPSSRRLPPRRPAARSERKI